MRFRQRRNVDFPQPDGPMMAVTDRSWNVMETSRTAAIEPNLASRCSTRMWGASVTVPATEAGEPSITCTETSPGDDSGDETDDEDEAEEDEGARPRLRVPIVVGA